MLKGRGESDKKKLINLNSLIYHSTNLGHYQLGNSILHRCIIIKERLIIVYKLDTAIFCTQNGVDLTFL